jgi:hypothetical protein
MSTQSDDTFDGRGGRFDEVINRLNLCIPSPPHGFLGRQSARVTALHGRIEFGMFPLMVVGVDICWRVPVDFNMGS